MNRIAFMIIIKLQTFWDLFHLIPTLTSQEHKDNASQGESQYPVCQL